jgi:hypothetical protein
MNIHQYGKPYLNVSDVDFFPTTEEGFPIEETLSPGILRILSIYFQLGPRVYRNGDLVFFQSFSKYCLLVIPEL